MLQVLLVAGGWVCKPVCRPLISTEILVGDSPVWTAAKPLPKAIDHTRGITLDNYLYMIGK